MPYTDQNVQNLVINQLSAETLKGIPSPSASEVYVLTDPAGQSMNNLTSAGYVVLNNSKALETGAVSSDPTIYTWIASLYNDSASQTQTDTVSIGGTSVQITYKLAKTGSKIADSSFRTQISNLYAQDGSAPYFTIDTTNQTFTLPPGEIYGKIEKAAASGGGGFLPSQTGNAGKLLTTDGTNPSWGDVQEVACVVETYQSGANWYRVYSDGWCEQGGVLSRSTTGTLSVTLMKTFMDSSYQVQATNLAANNYTSASTFYTPYVLSKTASGFSMSSNAAIASIGYFVWYAVGNVGV